MPESTRRIVQSKLDDMDPNERDASLFRIAGASLVLVCSLFSALATYYAKLTLRNGYRFLRAAAAFAAVYVVYRVMTHGARVLMAAAAEEVVAAVREQDRVDDRVAAVAGAGVLLALAYGLYKVAEWCVAPFTEFIEMMPETGLPADLQTDGDEHPVSVRADGDDGDASSVGGTARSDDDSDRADAADGSQ